jgi:hypothetical protein
MRDFAIAQGINRATEQVDALTQQQQMTLMQRRQAQDAIAKQMALDLTRAGASQSQIAGAYQSIAPEAIKDSNDAIRVGTMAGDSEMLKLGQQLQKSENKPRFDLQDDQQTHDSQMLDKRLAADMRIAGMKQDKKFTDQEFATIKDYQKRLETTAKKNFDAIQQARTAKELANSGNPLADNALPTFMARATGEVGNLTEAERAPFGSSRDLVSRIQQVSKNLANGKLTDDNRKFVIQLADTFEKRNRAAVESTADRMARQAGSLLRADPADIRGRILPADFDAAFGAAPASGGGAAPGLPAGIPQGSVLTTVRDKKSGGMVKVYKSPDNKYYPAQ